VSAALARPGRPCLVALLTLLPLGLALWYLLLAARAALLFVGEFLFGGPAPVPLDVRLGPLLLAVAALGAMIWSVWTTGGLFGGAWWARISVVLLALFALPVGYPTDLAIAGVLVVVLFVMPGVRGYFR
jgi:hypothetical protein